MAVFSPIFVADTKLIFQYDYDFVAPLKNLLLSEILFENLKLYEKFVYKHSGTIEYVKN